MLKGKGRLRITVLTLSVLALIVNLTALTPLWADDLIAVGGIGSSPAYVPTAYPKSTTLRRPVTAADYPCVATVGRVFCVEYSTSPSAVPDPAGLLVGKQISAVSGSENTNCAVAGGLLYCWGDAPGDGSQNSTVPVLVTGELAGRTVSAVSSAYGACAVSEGHLYCWGRPGISVPTRIDSGLGDRTVTAVSMTSFGSCVIADSSVLCRSYDTDFETVAMPAGTGPVTALSVGVGVRSSPPGLNAQYVCMVADARAYCAGSGGHGQLGNGQRQDALLAVPVQPPANLVGARIDEIRVATETACARSGDDIFCWGAGAVQLVNDPIHAAYGIPTMAKAMPANTAPITLLSVSEGGALVVAGGRLFGWGDTGPIQTLDGRAMTLQTAPSGLRFANSNCGSASGSVYCWSYQAGGSGPQALTALSLNGMRAVTSISQAHHHSCLIPAHHAYCRGKDTHGQLGNGSAAQAATYKPVKGVLRTRRVSVISAAEAHTCAVAEGEVYCWGFGQFGTDRLSRTQLPQRVPLGSGRATAVATGPSELTCRDTMCDYYRPTGPTTTCAIAGGRAYCWGWNKNWLMGTGTQDTVNRPTVLAGAMQGLRATTISLSTNYGCATAGGRVFCWGKEIPTTRPGQETASPVPVRMSGLPRGVTKLALGDDRACALASGKVYCWDSGERPHQVRTTSLTSPRIRDIASAYSSVSTGAPVVLAITGP